MPRARRTETKQKSIAVQTDNIDSNSEINRLQEQLKLLQLEYDTFKKHVDDNFLSVNHTSDKNKPELMQTPRRINKITNSNSQVTKSATKSKLCTCKGTCSSKICGCVKSERKCGPTCRCDSQICQNKELENKENMGDIQNENVQETTKLENMPLKDKTEYQNLFSPEGIENEAQLMNIQFEDICFDTQKKLIHTSDKELESKNKNKIKDDVIKKRNKDQNIKTTNKINKKKAQEPNETNPKIMQASPSSEDENKMSMQEADTSFDPMKPKRQLLRTPPRGNIEYEPGDAPTTVKTPTENITQKVDIIPDELNQENVDLDELHIELANCDRCKRKFYPWRIGIHKSVCLGM